jgi:hypothetical protein
MPGKSDTITIITTMARGNTMITTDQGKVYKTIIIKTLAKGKFKIITDKGKVYKTVVMWQQVLQVQQ